MMTAFRLPEYLQGIHKQMINEGQLFIAIYSGNFFYVENVCVCDSELGRLIDNFILFWWLHEVNWSIKTHNAQCTKICSSIKSSPLLFIANGRQHTEHECVRDTEAGGKHRPGRGIWSFPKPLITPLGGLWWGKYTVCLHSRMNNGEVCICVCACVHVCVRVWVRLQPTAQ